MKFPLLAWLCIFVTMGMAFVAVGTEFLSILFDVNQYKHHHFIVLVLFIIL